MIRVHFKDEGQDCLWWDIDGEGVVQDCDMQSWVWKGTKVDMTTDLRVDGHLVCTFKDGHVGKWKHPVERVQRPPEVHRKRPRCQEKMVGSQQPCKHRAKYEVTSPIGTGKLVCGIHARQWLPTGLRALQSQESKGEVMRKWPL